MNVLFSLPTLLATFAPFQGPGPALEVSGGVLGRTLEIELGGAPGQGHVLIPSPTAGPTPVSVLDPSHPPGAQLDIDLSLISLALPGAYPPGGRTTHSLPIPNDASLRGRRIYLQTLDVPGPTSLIAGWSNPATAFLSASGDVNPGPSNLPTGRALSTASALPSGDVLITGGSTGGFLTPVPLRDALIVDRNTRSLRPLTSQMSAGRAFHSATELSSGSILLFGGFDPSRAALSSCDVFDPATETFSPLSTTGAPIVARAIHTSTRLANGEILILGGSTDIGTGRTFGPFDRMTDSAQLLDPVTGFVTDLEAIPFPVAGHTATLLRNGWVLVCGGMIQFFGVPMLNPYAWIFDPLSLSFFHLGSGPRPGRVFHEATPYSGNLVVLTGGLSLTLQPLGFQALDAADVYDATTRTFRSLPPLNARRLGHAALVAPNGSFMVLGGVDGSIPLGGTYAFQGVGTIEVLQGGSFVTLPNTITPRGLCASAPFGGSHVVMAGGLTSATAPTDLVEFFTF